MIIYKVDAKYIYLGYQMETVFIPTLRLKPIDVLNLQGLMRDALFDWHKLTKKQMNGDKPH